MLLVNLKTLVQIKNYIKFLINKKCKSTKYLLITADSLNYNMCSNNLMLKLPMINYKILGCR